ncbi:MAG: hypothetical protein KDD15_01420 [Lewinella sp.]|nr:hypothetical protein [Lewinella sp.]
MDHPISDLHVHCGLKGYASEGYPGFEDFTIWDYYPIKEAELKKLNFMLREAIKDTAKDSQAHLDHCVESQLCAPFLAIYPVERQMFALDPQKPFKNIFKLLLRGKQHAYLGAAVAGFPLERVQKIQARVKGTRDEGVDYYREFRKERDYLLRQTATSSKKYPDLKFRIASNYEEFTRYLADKKTICGLFTVEGTHSFGHYLFNSTFKKEFEDLDPTEREVLETSFIRNITEVKTENHSRETPFFVTFCHHYNNLLAGHARSFSDKSSFLPGINKPGMRHLFNQEPGRNRGFTSLGLQVLDLLLDRTKGRRILIDTKHMSVATRKTFYQIIKQKRTQENDHIPIIHSHAAVSGWLSLDEAAQYEETTKLDKKQFFSRWQINLTNEDILEIFDSDGIIGMVLHEGRIPGGGFKKAVAKLKKKLRKTVVGSIRHMQLDRELKDMYLKLVWSNIFHIIKVVQEERYTTGTPANAWKMIALGSDYDGLVDPMDTFPGVNDFMDLKQELIDYLKAGKEVFFSDNGIARPLRSEEIKALLFGRSPEEITADIFYRNTDRFLYRFFTDAYLSVRPQ